MQPLRSGSPSSSPGSRLRREPRSPFPVLLPVVSGSPFRARRVALRRILVLLVAEEGPHLALVDERPVVGDDDETPPLVRAPELRRFVVSDLDLEVQTLDLDRCFVPLLLKVSDPLLLAHFALTSCSWNFLISS